MLRRIFWVTLFLLSVCTSSAYAYSTSNIQLLYSNQFNGDAFIYDTNNGKKTTVTLEHFRTWEYGDLFMFADLMYGERFDGKKQYWYAEIAPRLSLSKLTQHDFKEQIGSDLYLATQVNFDDDYEAWLVGLGTDIYITGFNFVSLNLYQKRDNFKNHLTQITAAYQANLSSKILFEGFIDITEQDINTHNQLLYNVNTANHPLYVGFEWVYYDYSNNGISNQSNSLQVMARLQF